jgi:cytochrome c biogenesis protein CcmG/thiol:disulfide interchange protein DsbE
LFKIIQMKKAILLFSIVGITSCAYAQEKKTDIPSVNVKTLDNKTINTSQLGNDGKPMIIDFWATWCKPCVSELNAIAEEYADWQSETGVKLVAISIDDTRTMSTVAPFVNGKGWDYEVYLDSNSDFKRAMNVNNVPHTFLFDGNGKLVAQHNTYAPGDEDNLIEEIRKLVNK